MQVQFHRFKLYLTGIETKILSDISVNNSGSNCTLLELKHRWLRCGIFSHNGSNCTLLELKLLCRQLYVNE